MECSRQGKCVQHGKDLTADDFRKGPRGPASESFFKTCCYCRGKQPVAPATPRSQRGIQDCAQCGFTFRTPHFRDNRQRLRLTCETCRQGSQIIAQGSNESDPEIGQKRMERPPNSPNIGIGSTPSSLRAQSRQRTRAPSPSPARPVPPPFEVETRRPVRMRRAPQLPYATQPTPPSNLQPPPIPARPREDRHAGQKRCSVCRTWQDIANFAKTVPDDYYLSCLTCREGQRARYHAQQREQQSSPMGSSTSDTFLAIPPKVDNLESTCITEEAITCIQGFHQKLEAEAIETCENCNEAWFGMDMRGDKCAKCRKDPKKYTAENQMDPGELFG